MNKSDIINAVNEAPFGKDLILLHGVSMVMHGVRETTNDIDCYLLADYPDLELTTVEGANGLTFYEHGEFDFGTMEKRIIPFVEIDGFKCQTLASIVEDKLKWARPKDFDAIDEINRFRKNK